MSAKINASDPHLIRDIDLYESSVNVHQWPRDRCRVSVVPRGAPHELARVRARAQAQAQHALVLARHVLALALALVLAHARARALGCVVLGRLV